MTDEELKEGINEMKMCLLCGFIPDGEMKSTDVATHKRGMHQRGKIHPTYGFISDTWAPLKKHKDYELHVRYAKLFNLKI